MKWSRPNRLVNDPEEQQNWDSLASYLDGLAVGAGGAPSGPAGGDLAGTYPNPTVKASVALTGNPTAPTALPGDNDTSVATTAFVAAAVAAATTPSLARTFALMGS